MSETELLERWRKQASDDWCAQDDQRDRANEDMRFVSIPGAQWEGFLDDLYEGEGKKSRPRFEYDRLAAAINRFYAEWTQNRSSVSFRPDDGKTSDREAELLDGLFRRDMRRNDGIQAIDNAVSEAATCGFGAFRIATHFIDDEEDGEQLIQFEPIFSAYSSVLFDSNARRIDKSDAKRCTLLHEFSKDAFEERWPDADLTSVDVNQDDRRDLDINWFGKDRICVAERYWVEEKREEARVYLNPVKLQEETYWLEDIDLVIDEIEQMGFQLVESKKMKRARVFKAIFSGNQILEPKREISGKYIPVIPVYGYWRYIDGMERYCGIPTPYKDAQRLFNLMVSRMAEVSASSPRRTPIFAPEQMDDPDHLIQALWNRAQYESVAYLLAKPAYDKQGSVIATGGPLGYLEPPTLDQTSVALLDLTGNYLQSETGGAPQDVLDPEASGKAINAQAMRIDMNTQPIMDNIKVALRRAGEVYRFIAADVYSAPRTATLLAQDGEEYQARIMDVVLDRQTGTYQHIHDITKGRFEVVVDTGPGYHSKRQQTVENLKDILQSIDQNSPYYGPAMAMLIENLDGIGLNDLKRFNRRMMLTQGLVEPEDEEEAAIIQQAQQNQQPSAEEDLIRATAQREAAEAEESATRSQKNMLESQIKQMKAQQELLEGAGLGPLSDQQKKLLVEVVEGVNQGVFQRDSGVAMLMQLFGVDAVTANQLLGQPMGAFAPPPGRQRMLLQ